MSEEAQSQQTPYRVLARKYRPSHFDELVGQDALVRTLKNAIESGRIAQAYMLTGIRGTGKTTTARIIAKALNYKGPDGKAGPTTGPTDDCELCQAIAEDRHPDVMEMDAASRTGVDDIREILDGVRYAPSAARYKVYIIDEVHMLSKAAFNALLKTLEEPPAHVIFIFATTEIRKVPVTVLSRCQRFDLRRVDIPTLEAHYKAIGAQENVGIDDSALSLIARAADGSVRDGLSLLDQAIALAGGQVTGQQVQDMLGLADRTLTLDVLENGLKGACAPALDVMADLYKKGADPAVLINDMLDFTHMMTRLRAVPEAKEMHGALAPETVARLADLAGKLSMPALGRAWQILLKGLGEIAHAPNPQAAAEMVVIRLAYTADLPDPADLIRKIEAGKETSAGGADQARTPVPEREPAPVAVAVAGGGAAVQTAAVPQSEPAGARALNTLADIEAVLRENSHMILAGELYQYVHLVKLCPGQLDIRLADGARSALASELGNALREVTGARWMVSIAGEAGAPTLAQQAQAARQAEIDAASAHPVVQAVIETFPGAQVQVRHNAENDNG